MTQIISDNGISYGATSASHSLYAIGASVSSGAITVTLAPTTIAFRSTVLDSGTPVVVRNALPLSLTISASDSFGLVTAAGKQRIVILAINNAGTMELAASALYGGVPLDETGVITTTTSATASTSIEASAVRVGVAYKVVGFVDATFTTAVGWGSLALVQGAGGQALAAMSSLGYGQTWQNVFGSRASGTTYYNTTGKPIQLRIAGSTAQALVVNGATIFNSVAGELWIQGLLIPPGASYSNTGTYSQWWELR